MVIDLCEHVCCTCSLSNTSGLLIDFVCPEVCLILSIAQVISWVILNLIKEKKSSNINNLIHLKFIVLLSVVNKHSLAFP